MNATDKVDTAMKKAAAACWGSVPFVCASEQFFYERIKEHLLPALYDTASVRPSASAREAAREAADAVYERLYNPEGLPTPQWAIDAVFNVFQRHLASPSWRPIESAPKTGEHILAAEFNPDRIGFGFCGGKKQSMMTVVHWWDNPGEEGWYASVDSQGEYPFPATHWKPLEEKETS